MSPQYPLKSDSSHTTVLEAAETRQPVTITWQAETGWQVTKGRFADADPDAASIYLHLPAAAGTTRPEVSQDVSVSFRRGSRKCVFTSCLIDSFEGRARDGGKSGLILRLSWPDSLQELQRRLFHRTPVPPGRYIPVDLWLSQANEDLSEHATAQRGKMVDLSAGGLSIELPRETRPRWREDDQFTCRFSAGPNRPPVEVAARLTNYTRLSEGHVRVGLQFLGLDGGDRGRQALQQISFLTSRLRRN